MHHGVRTKSPSETKASCFSFRQCFTSCLQPAQDESPPMLLVLFVRFRDRNVRSLRRVTKTPPKSALDNSKPTFMEELSHNIWGFRVYVEHRCNLDLQRRCTFSAGIRFSRPDHLYLRSEDAWPESYGLDRY